MATSTTPSFLLPPPQPQPQRHYNYHYKPIKLTSFSTHAPRRPNRPRMEISSSRHRWEDKVIMGATGSGKSRLSVELSTPFFSEIINSDKMQVYKGLDITTNKNPNNDPHHLLGNFDPSHGEFSASDFCRHAGDTISDITSELYEPDTDNRTGLTKAIGVPEFDRCFKQYPPVGPMQNKGDNWPHREISFSRQRRKDKVIVIMGATGTGKSRLSVELATHFHSEIINCDKIKVYKGLDITSDKIPIHQRNNIPHHLLGNFDPSHGEFSPSDFRRHAGDIISDITARRKLPIIVGGSNSFIHALLVERFDSELNVFENESSTTSLSEISSDLRYNCCFIWMDISFPVLSKYLLKRVDDMFDSGMVNELAEFYEPDADNRTGLRKAIGVPEFD
ncbi:adenylate isopentenyltransferase, partial [Trifolium medium]|nr:adenylate isopentenyltransferase [Trifolium medium]